MRRIPQPVKIVACLLAGLGLGLAYPQNPIVLAIARSGTWFPRTIVTLATAIVFILMSAALARTLQTHARGTRFLTILVTLYVVMAAVSLLYVSAWIPVLTGLPLSRADVPLLALYTWWAVMSTIGFLVFFGRPLVGVVGGIGMGACTALAWWRRRG